MPLTANEVNVELPFVSAELLYRRVGPDEINSKGEVKPLNIAGISFKAEVESAPSVLRSEFSQPYDVLHELCAEKDVTGWFAYYVRVDCLPEQVVSGDERVFRFFPKHVPLTTCGAHSVVACCLADDADRGYVKPSAKVINDFKVKFALGLRLIEQTFDITTKEPISAESALTRNS